MLKRRTFVAGSLLFLFPQGAGATGHNPLCVHRDAKGGAFLPAENTVVYGHNFSAHASVAKSRGNPVNVVVESKREYDFAYLTLRNGHLPRKSVVVFDRSNNPQPALARIDQAVNKTYVVYNVPRTVSEIRATHGPGVSEAQAQQNLVAIRAIRDRFDRMGGIDAYSLPGSSRADAVARFVNRKQPNDLVILVSHLEQSLVQRAYRHSVMRFSDGTFYSPVQRAPVSGPRDVEIRNIFSGGIDPIMPKSNGGPTCWTLGCNTWSSSVPRAGRDAGGLITTRPLTYDNAARTSDVLIRGRTLRDKISDVQSGQKLRTQRPDSELPKDPPGHEPLLRPSETFIQEVNLTPGMNLESSSIMVA